MQSLESNGTSQAMRWTGRILSTIAALFMLMDGVMKIVRPPVVVTASAQMGYAASALPGIGIILLLFVLLYIAPRTSTFGAILLTGFLGGAVASKVRTGAGWFDVAFPLVFAFFVWGGLWLRDSRLRQLLPLSAPSSSFAPARPNSQLIAQQ